MITETSGPSNHGGLAEDASIHLSRRVGNVTRTRARVMLNSLIGPIPL
ncbi:hypothetical protein [Dactylosporangium sp. CA-092794]